MAWKETHVFDEKIRFVTAFFDKEDPRTMTDLCRGFGVSRRTGYAVIDRYHAGGFEALRARSRAPLSHPNITPADLEDALVAARLEHPRWGPKKLLHILRAAHPEESWPVVSTAGRILKRRGLVVPRKTRHRTPPYTQPLAAARRPNDVWTTDHKGSFRTHDRSYCVPLTIGDAMSRFQLELQATTSTSIDAAWPHFEHAFRVYGLPARIRSDNGTPFASHGLGGLTRLSVWWIKLGILPERIEPGCPEQNGRHERFHLTLEQEVGVRTSLAAQQRAYKHFLTEYNTVRPHEALGMRTPAEVYEPSHRPYPRKLPVIEYPSRFEVRVVRPKGEIKWQGELMYVSESLAGEPVGLERVSDHQWRLYFSFLDLAVYNERTRKLRRPPRRQPPGQEMPGEST
jgi:putative transposase